MYNAEDCLKFMKVSKSFKSIVEVFHKDIYKISLGFCTKKFCLRNTWPAFQVLVANIEIETKINFPKKDIRDLYCNSSLFRVLLHFFLCKRSCDGVDNYCWICSRVRNRNFENSRVFDDMIMERVHDIYKLVLTDRMIDFDVYLSRWGNFNVRNDNDSDILNK